MPNDPVDSRRSPFPSGEAGMGEATLATLPPVHEPAELNDVFETTESLRALSLRACRSLACDACIGEPARLPDWFDALESLRIRLSDAVRCTGKPARPPDWFAALESLRIRLSDAVRRNSPNPNFLQPVG